MRLTSPRFSVEQGNVVDFRCEVLVLKHAQGWYGADAAVAKKLGLLWKDGPKPGAYEIVSGIGKLGARTVLFEGLPSLRGFTYSTARDFARQAIEHLHQECPRAKQIAMTVHGVSVGLDERETFLSQLRGLEEALNSGALPDLLQVVFVEINAKRVGRLAEILEDHHPKFALTGAAGSAAQSSTGEPAHVPAVVPVTVEPLAKEKPHVFVAMPFTEGMEDVYIFGIQSPVQNAGLLCERVDMAIFSGDILDRIKSRIETSLLVIADLTGANANVYLEVGYAWGRNKDTVLLCKNVDDLKFDVRGQRCLIYSSINDLNKKLTEELKSRLIHSG